MKGSQLLYRHLRKHWLLYITAILTLAAANVVNVFFPRVIKLFTDQLSAKQLTRADITNYGLALLGIGAGYGVLFGIGQFTNHRLGRIFEFTTRERLFRHFTQLSEAYFSKNGIGKLLSLVMNDVSTVRESIANGVNQLTNASILSLAVIVMLLISDVPLFLIGICVLPLLLIPFLVVYFRPRIRDQSRWVQETLARMTESAEEQFGGIRVTKKFAVEEIARERFGKTVDDIRDNQLKLVRLSSMFQSMLPFLGALSMVVALIFGGILTYKGTISLGDFVALTLYLRMIVNPLQQIGNVINMMQRARASLDRLNQVLDIQPDIQEAEAAKPLSSGALDIAVDGLTFSYPDARHPSLIDLKLQLQPGRTLGIVGKTGSGKTTLVKLLLRIYDPPRGSIRIGGTDILDISLESLRTQIAYVPQDGFLFSTTIGDNIAFYNRTVEQDRVVHAAKMAEIYESVASFPDGFATRLGERGLSLSGGQRQRTSLARGIIKDAPILILDDSVSAVDAVTETRIIANLRQARRGKTTILIAHRISALRHADEIIVMDEGRIIEHGSHQELLRKGGYYASLYKIQEEGSAYGKEAR